MLSGLLHRGGIGAGMVIVFSCVLGCGHSPGKDTATVGHAPTREVHAEGYFLLMRSAAIPLTEELRGRWSVLCYHLGDKKISTACIDSGVLKRWCSGNAQQAQNARIYSRGFAYGYTRGGQGLPLEDKGSSLAHGLLGAPLPWPEDAASKRVWREGAEKGWVHGRKIWDSVASADGTK
jgi:hypothetical protein